MNPEKRVLLAIESAQNILARYIEPEVGPHDAEATIDALLTVLDDKDVVAAVRELRLRIERD
jgi:hypothetical protein